MNRLFVAVCLLLAGGQALAGPLRPGDFVMLTTAVGGGYRIVSLDAATLAPTEVAAYGYVSYASDLVVDRQGAVLITSPAAGIARIDPATGLQALIATLESLGGGRPSGITLSESGEIYVSMQGSAPRVVRLSADGAFVGVVTSGGFLTTPEGLAFGANDALYVCEVMSPYIGTLARGALIRVDPASGAQTQLAVGAPLNRPHDLAVAPDGSLWSIGYGIFNGKLAYLVRTRTEDGFSANVPGGDNSASGIAIRADGLTVYAGCDWVHADCNSRYVRLFPSGSKLWMFASLLAVVPDIATPAAGTSWGRLKVRYR